jgi:hypothetical protein
MAFRPPNYQQQRGDRNRAKQQKKQEKQQRREEEAVKRKAERGDAPELDSAATPETKPE